MKIAIASGKGGTGKTTLSVNLACAFGQPVQLLDCDVEEPNVHLFLSALSDTAATDEMPGNAPGNAPWNAPGKAQGNAQTKDVAGAVVPVEMRVPVIDSARCMHCGECAQFCEFHALVALPDETLIFPELCHGCGGCWRVCPHNAISEISREIGQIRFSQHGLIHLIEGRLAVGETMAPQVIREVLAHCDADRSVILDAPPGTACPVVVTLANADYAVLVTEPTPFGLNDLRLAVELTREVGVPFGVVINRDGAGDQRVEDWCKEEGIALLAKIPDDRRIAEAYSRGEILVDALPEYRPVFANLMAQLLALVGGIPSGGG